MRAILIQVDEHDAIPDGCFMRFSALGPTRPVKRLRCELRDGQTAVCLVEGRAEDDSKVPAWTAPVDDSGAGESWLVGGGAHGLRLRPEGAGGGWAEPYLLVSAESIVE